MITRSIAVLTAFALASTAGAQTTTNRMAPMPTRPGTKPAPVRPVRPKPPTIQPVRPKPPTTKPVPLPHPVKPRPPKPIHPVRPRPPVHWPGYNWHHGSWQIPGAAWYNHWSGYGRIMLYANPGYRGRGLYLRNSEPNLNRWNFNDRAQSLHASGRWQVCSKTNYRGTCRIIYGSQSHLYGIGMDRRITSLRYLGR